MSTKRMIFWHASAVQAPPWYSGSPAISATGQPSNRTNAVMIERPKPRPISNMLSRSTSASMMRRM